jgi:hypothetical protein
MVTLVVFMMLVEDEDKVRKCEIDKINKKG